MKIIDWLCARLAEETTWRGLLLVVTGFSGWKISPDLAVQIIALGVAGAGVINVIKKQAASKADVATAINAATDNVPKAIIIDEKTLLPK